MAPLGASDFMSLRCHTGPAVWLISRIQTAAISFATAPLLFLNRPIVMPSVFKIEIPRRVFGLCVRTSKIDRSNRMVRDLIEVTALGLLVGGTIGVLTVMLGELLWIWI
jgi:hypothetical protein